EVQNGLGMALRALGRLDEAVERYSKAIALKPDFAEACNNCANVLQDLGREDEAVELYRKALALKPAYADAPRNLAPAMLALGSAEDAVAECRSALALRPDDAIVHSDLIFYLNFVPDMTNKDQQSERRQWWEMQGRRFVQSE